MDKLDYCRRFAATWLGFVIFGVGGIMMKLVLLPYTLNGTSGSVARQLARAGLSEHLGVYSLLI